MGKAVRAEACAHVERGLYVLAVAWEGGGGGPRCCRFVFLPTFISSLVYFSLKRGCCAKSWSRISCECVILQPLPGCFCDLGNTREIQTNSSKHSLARKPLSSMFQFRGGTSLIPSLAPFQIPSEHVRLRDQGLGSLRVPESTSPCPTPHPR